MDLYLQHTPQPFPWGCQYYSLYALLGDARILDDVTEANSIRFDERARELGYCLSYLYADCTCTAVMPEVVWQAALGGTAGVAALHGNVGLFLLGMCSPKNLRVMHTVGIAMRAVSYSELTVQVFDPCAAGEKEYCTLADFLASPYGKVYEVKQVLPLARLAAELPRAFGPDAPYVRPEVRQAWEASLLAKEAA